MKLKSKTVKVSSSISPEKVDRLGEEYESLQEQAETSASSLARLKNDIKDLAEFSGNSESDGKYLHGRKFRIGYKDVAGRMSFNPSKAKELLDRRTFEACCSMQIDEAKLETMVHRGKLPKKLFLQLFDAGAPSRRIVVERK